VLDANRSHLTKGEWDAEVGWYASTLDDFEGDPAVPQ
jgi:hypothetical protein